MKFRHNDIIHKLIISSIQIYYENHRMYHQGNQFDLFLCNIINVIIRLLFK